jgi:hypothetical protein
LSSEVRSFLLSRGTPFRLLSTPSCWRMAKFSSAAQISITVQFFGVRDQRFQTQYAFASGINLQGQASAEDLEDRQIIRRFSTTTCQCRAALSLR